jgi:hypothetical protein
MQSCDHIDGWFFWNYKCICIKHTYLGCWVFLTTFWPYLRHLYPSSNTSTSLRVLKQNLGSLTFLLTFFFIRTAPMEREALPQLSMPLLLLLKWCTSLSGDKSLEFTGMMFSSWSLGLEWFMEYELNLY